MSDDFNILIVDSEKTIRTLCHEALSKAGYTVDMAKSAESAVDKLNNYTFNVIISDINLAASNRFHLYKRALDIEPNLRGMFIIIAAYPNRDAIRFFKDNDCKYLMRPFLFKELISEVAELKRIRHATFHIGR